MPGIATRRSRPLDAWTERDLAWLAGLLEGEGCFSFINHAAGLANVSIWLTMSDADVVQRVADLFDQKMNRQERMNGHVYWRVSVGGYAAVEVMERILPQMGGRRRARIEELLANWYTNRPHLKGWAA